MSLAQRWQDIRTGFERPFWVANITELFERLSYYGSFAFLARYLNETLQFPTEQATGLTGLFGGLVWFFAAFGGALADRMGFRRALSLAYLILSIAYFLLGSVAAPWLAPVRNAVPVGVLMGFILALPALGIALVKPAVVGTTARASNENVRSIGYSIYYTLVNVGGALGPLVGSYVQRTVGVENVFIVAAVSVFVMFFAVLIFFKEPRRGEEATSLRQTARNFAVVLGRPTVVMPALVAGLVLIILRSTGVFGTPWWVWVLLLAAFLAFANRFGWFLLIFSGYWIVFWQEFITLPLYVARYIDKDADTGGMLATGPLVVISLTVLLNLVIAKMRSMTAITLGTLVSGIAWVLLILNPSVMMAYLTLVVVAIGEIIQAPKYYDYISRLAPAGQQGTYMGFAFLPIGIGSLLAGPISGWAIRRFGEQQNEPGMIWWVVTGIGVATALLLFVYDKVVRPPENAATA